MKTKRTTGSKGSVSIEFSLVFVILLLLFYGIASYTVPLLLAASYQQLAADTLRQAIILGQQQKDDELPSIVADMVATSWLPTDWVKPCLGYGDGYLLINGDTWSTCLRHNRPASIMPPLTFFGKSFPALPEQIVGEASLRIR